MFFGDFLNKYKYNFHKNLYIKFLVSSFEFFVFSENVRKIWYDLWVKWVHTRVLNFTQADLSQRECVGMISACADELRQVFDYWQKTELKTTNNVGMC